MTACGSLQHIFDNPLPENPSSLIESLSSSWKQIKPLKPHVDHSFTEIFGELHFKETSDLSPFSSSFFSAESSSSSSSPAFPIDSISQGRDCGQQEDKWVPVSPFSSNGYAGSYHKRSESFSSLNSGSLQLCTEGLGFESLDNVEDLKFEFQDSSQNHNNSNNNNSSNNNDNQSDNNINSYNMREKVYVRGNPYCHYSKGKANGKPFPPPISCIGRTGKPWVCFQPYRQDGHFVLKEIRIPTQEFLHACREDGRLRLCFVQPSEDTDDYDDSDDIVEEDDAGEEEKGDGETGIVGKIDEEEREESKDGVEEEGGGDEEEAEIRDDFATGTS